MDCIEIRSDDELQGRVEDLSIPRRHPMKYAADSPQVGHANVSLRLPQGLDPRPTAGRG